MVLQLTNLLKGICLLFICMSLVSAGTSFFFLEYKVAYVFSFATLLYAFIYFFLKLSGYKKEIKRVQNKRYTFFIWLFTCFIGSIPIWLIAFFSSNPDTFVFKNYFHALFESTSGMTSTGLTLLNNPANVEKGLLLWRSLLQWIGGLGMAVWITFLVDDNDTVKAFYQVEGSHLSKETNFTKMTSFISLFYVIATLILISLVSLEIGLWEGVNHAMAAISTGGFTVTQNSFQNYPLWVLVIFALFMYLSAINFFLFYNAYINKSIKDFFKDKLLIQYMLFVLFSLVLFSFIYQTDGPKDYFNLVSATTTSGFTAHDLSHYNEYIFLFIILIMFIGGMSGSTAGGLKQRNIRFLFKTLVNQVKGVKFSEDKLEQKSSRLRKALTTLFLWCMLIILATFIIGFLKTSYQDKPNYILFDVVSALTNTGLSSGFSSSQNSWTIQLIFILLMLLGRINLYILMELFFSALPKRLKRDKAT